MALNTTSTQQDGGGEAVPTDGDDGLDVFANAWAEQNGGEEADVTPEAPAEEEENAADPQEEPQDGDADATEQEPADEPEKYEVNVNGQTLQVAKDELIRGYQRLSDYTRKTQEVAETRKQAEARIAQVEDAEKYVLGLLERYDQQEQEPDWVALEANDPIGFQKAQAKYLNTQRARQAAQAERQRIQQQQNERFQAFQAEKTREEAKALVDKLTEAKGDRKKVGEIANTAMRHAAETYGFTPDELQSTNDHRVVLALIDAMKYRQLRQAKPAISKAIGVAPRSVRPGQPVPTHQALAQRMSAAKQELRQSGSVDAFADLWTATNQGR